MTTLPIQMPEYPSHPLAMRELVPAVAEAVIAHRDEAEAQRRLPAELLETLRAGGLFRLQTPRELGGYEAPLPDVLDVYEALGRLDGSVAWSVWNGNLGVTAGMLDPAGVAAVWGDGPDPVVANAAQPKGAATPDASGDGYRLSGRWDIVSAVDASDWAVLFGLVMGDAGPVFLAPGLPDVRAFFVPTRELTILDTWHTGGMRGTGSNSVVAEGVHVPEALAPSPFAPARIDRPAFRMPAFTALSCGAAAVCLGLAQAAIDAVVELAPSKATAAGCVLADLGGAQRDVATADTDVRAARLLLRDAAARVWDAAVAGEVTFADRGALRSAMCHAAAVARRVATAMYELGSSSSLYEGNRLERIFRDAHAAAQHGLLNPLQLEPWGRHLLGVDPAVGMY